MSDDTTDPTHGVPDDDLTALEAVSAFVDGVATPDERALVESSPELRALAARWSTSRDLLAGDADLRPDPAVRDAGIAAAMAVYDDLHAAPATAPATATSSPPARVLRFERRQRQQRWLMGAAAAVVVLFVGGIVASGGLGGIGGSDQDDSSVAGAPTAVAEDGAPADASAKADPAASSMADDSFTLEAAEATAADGMAESAQAGSETTAASADTLAPEATTFGAGAGGGVEELSGPAQVLETLSSEEELRAFAAARTAQLPLPGLEFPCVEPDVEAMGTATFRGVEVVVVQNPTSGEVLALDLATCDVVASARP